MRINSTLILVLLLISITLIILNNVLVASYNLIHRAISVELRVQIFSISILIFALFQTVIFKYMTSVTRDLFINGQKLRIWHNGIMINQYFLLAAMLFILYEVLIISSYNLVMILIVSTLSYLSSAVTFILFSYRSIIWILHDRNVSVILYLVSTIFLALNLITSLVYTYTALSELLHTPTIKERFGNDNRSMIEQALLYYFFLITAILSFFSSLAASAYLLKSHSTQIPLFVYYTLFIIPIVYYVSQYTPISLYVLKLLIHDPSLLIFTYIIVFTSSNAVGGILIGISFWITAKKVTHSEIRKYLYLAGGGYLLLFTSNYALNSTGLSYPPFGIIGVPFVALASYMVFVGVYRCVSSLAHDEEIRKLIRKMVSNEGIISSMATAGNYHRMENKVIEASKKLSGKLELKTGIKATIQDEEIKEYMIEILSEFEKSK